MYSEFKEFFLKNAVEFVIWIYVMNVIILYGNYAEKFQEDKVMKKKKEISILRFSAAEYLTFITATGESDVNAIYFDENVWLPRKQ